MARMATSGGGQLACCHGYSVAAGRRRIGTVETPMFAADAAAPDYLIVRMSPEIAGTFRLVPAALVASVDRELRTVTLAADGDAIVALPERLPLDGRSGV